MSSLPIKCLHLNYLNILFVKHVCFISYHLEYVSFFMCKIMSISKWGLENKKMWSVWYSIPSDIIFSKCITDNLRQQKRKYVFFPSVENLSKFDVSSRRRLFLNCLGRNQDCFPPYILYTLVTIHYSHKGYHLWLQCTVLWQSWFLPRWFRNNLLLLLVSSPRENWKQALS